MGSRVVLKKYERVGSTLKKIAMSEASEIVLRTTITCPHCGHREEEEMPVEACRFFYECPNCKEMLRPREGDCCVYCSYGDHPCPPVQKNGNGACC